MSLSSVYHRFTHGAHGSPVWNVILFILSSNAAFNAHIFTHTCSLIVSLIGLSDSKDTGVSNNSGTPPSHLQISRKSSNAPARDQHTSLALGAAANIVKDKPSLKSISPLPLPLPLSSSPTHHLSPQQQQFNQQPNQNILPSSANDLEMAKSPKIPPPAPVHATIPLPEVDECDHGSNIGHPHVDNTFDADARQLQQLQMHQQIHGLGDILQQVQSQYQTSELPQTQLPIEPAAVQVLQSATIDLANLALGGDDGPASVVSDALQGRKLFGIPTSQSQGPLTFDSNHHYLQHAPSPLDNAPFHTSVSESALGGGSMTGVNRASGTGVSDANKTPNVYINGLPPHYPEDELFNLASEFGPIRSVRTFTRHVRDSESGYGFVL